MCTAVWPGALQRCGGSARRAGRCRFANSATHTLYQASLQKHLLESPRPVEGSRQGSGGLTDAAALPPEQGIETRLWLYESEAQLCRDRAHVWRPGPTSPAAGGIEWRPSQIIGASSDSSADASTEEPDPAAARAPARIGAPERVGPRAPRP
eukprot:SAG31_NODE_527_length_14452_cov_4.274925_11_plen_151_part_01